MALYTQGYSFVAGLDEAGRGCLAGPVVAAAARLVLSLTLRMPCSVNCRRLTYIAIILTPFVMGFA